MNGMTTESRVAQTILERPLEIKVGSEIFKVAPPSTETLILVSEAISYMPKVDPKPKSTIVECLNIAKDCRVMGEILAILILGAKQSTWGNCFRLIERITLLRKRLPRKLRVCMPPKELSDTLQILLQTSQTDFFLGASTSLSEINLLQQTRRIETIVSGP